MNRHLSRELLPARRLGIVAASGIQSPGSAFQQFNEFTLQRFLLSALPWPCAPFQQVVIEVTAADRPGHKTTKVQAKS